MYRILFFLLFVFTFWFIHIIKRVFEHTYLWQIKEYRWDRMKAYIKESKVFSLRSFPTIIAAILVFFGILLAKFISCKILYLVVIFGFGYYAYSTLSAITCLFSKKLAHPAKSVRNALIVCGSLTLSFLPLILSFLFYRSIYRPQLETEVIESAQVVDIFPYQAGEAGAEFVVIPLETITVILFFNYLFGFDLAIPALVAIGACVTSVFSNILRKKK